MRHSIVAVCGLLMLTGCGSGDSVAQESDPAFADIGAPVRSASPPDDARSTSQPAEAGEAPDVALADIGAPVPGAASSDPQYVKQKIAETDSQLADLYRERTDLTKRKSSLQNDVVRLEEERRQIDQLTRGIEDLAQEDSLWLRASRAEASGNCGQAEDLYEQLCDDGFDSACEKREELEMACR